MSFHRRQFPGISASLIFMGVCLVARSVTAAPPAAPDGWEWRKVESLSDEFNGDRVDTEKWWKTNPHWIGRAPGLFKESQVSEAGGFLRLKNTQVAPTDQKNWVHTGFLASKSKTAVHEGIYVETRLKCARDGTVTGFWFSQPGGPQEIDVQEGVGHPANGNVKLTTAMRMNTHYNVNGEDKKTPRDQRIEPSAGEAFHTYGVWWQDRHGAIMYHGGKQVAHHRFGSEFTGRMQLNLNAETQDWIADPSPDRLKNDKLNTTLVDYVRTWMLVKTSKPAAGKMN